MKRFALLLSLLVAAFTLASCDADDSDSPVIYATLFPQYDVLRSLTEDVDVDIEYLLPPGISAHTYEPAPATLVKLSQSALLVYAYEELEPWVEGMLENPDFADVPTLRLADHVTLLTMEEEHAHEDDHTEDEHTEDVHTDDHDHDHDIDPHFWADPRNMILIVSAIETELVALFPDDADGIRAKASAYRAEMQDMHEQYLDWQAHRTSDTLMHGGHNAIGYMIAAYDVTYVNPYEGFSTDAEPTPQAIAEMIDTMTTYGIAYLYSETILSQTVANTIAEQTGATILYIHSMGNLSQADFEDGITILDMMSHNLEQYKIGLGYDHDAH
jgi:zinc transport system substrate-binding protein